MKYYLNILAALAAFVLAGCVSDEHLGGADGGTKSTTISFNGSTGKMSRAAGMRSSSRAHDGAFATRAQEGISATRASESAFATRAGALVGPAAAERLNDQFVVFGTKTDGGGTVQTVFDHYTVGYTAGSEYTTASNTNGWEYVGQPLSATSTLAGGTAQTIKLWDLSASQYDFVAFSTGTAGLQAPAGTVGDPGYPGTAASNTVIVTPVDKAGLATKAYTVTGAPDDLAKCYISDRVTSTKTATVREGVSYPYLDPMTFSFRSLGAKVRVGFFETILGYSVKDVKFYAYADNYEATLGTTPILLAGTECMPDGAGTMEVSFPVTDPVAPDYNKASMTLATTPGQMTHNVALSPLKPATFVARENIETLDGSNPGNIFLGRTVTTATTSDFRTVVPPGGPHTLTLKMDYTLLSTDISRETIKVRGATAVIPAAFCNWKPNSTYTYLFKITANTNGWTNPNEPSYAGLYPVTLDAIVAATEEGVQQTITLMAAPSITTYAKGEKVTEEPGTLLNYYERGDYYLYICLQPSTHVMEEDLSNVNLYMASTSDDSPITEANVADVLSLGTESPAGTWTMDKYTVLALPPHTLEIVDAMPEDDAPYSTAIPGNFARFKPTVAGTYVFEYISPAEQYEYDEFSALPGNESVTKSEFDDLIAAHDPTTYKPNKHYKVIVVK